MLLFVGLLGVLGVLGLVFLEPPFTDVFSGFIRLLLRRLCPDGLGSMLIWGGCIAARAATASGAHISSLERAERSETEGNRDNVGRGNVEGDVSRRVCENDDGSAIITGVAFQGTRTAVQAQGESGWTGGQPVRGGTAADGTEVKTWWVWEDLMDLIEGVFHIQYIIYVNVKEVQREDCFGSCLDSNAR